MSVTFSHISDQIQHSDGLNDIIDTDTASQILNNLVSTDIPSEDKALLRFAMNDIVRLSAKDALETLYVQFIDDRSCTTRTRLNDSK